MKWEPSDEDESPSVFFAPESVGATWSPSGADPTLEAIGQGSDWDIAVRYHEFKTHPAFRKRVQELRKVSAAAVLRNAQKILGAVVHPIVKRTAPYLEVSPFEQGLELNIEESVESDPRMSDPWVDFDVPRRQPIVLAVDTSLSMTGEKLALTAVALSVVLLEFPDDPIGIVAFENEAKVLKYPEERISVAQLVERFLDVPAQGYTHLEDGMRVALKLASGIRGRGGQRPPSTVLLTDGKYTAGKDPSYLAARAQHLVVLKMGGDHSSLELCQEIAKAGRGALYEVIELEALPTVMYGVVKDLLRGRSFA